MDLITPLTLSFSVVESIQGAFGSTILPVFPILGSADGGSRFIDFMSCLARSVSFLPMIWSQVL